MTAAELNRSIEATNNGYIFAPAAKIDAQSACAILGADFARYLWRNPEACDSYAQGCREAGCLREARAAEWISHCADSNCNSLGAQ